MIFYTKEEKSNNYKSRKIYMKCIKGTQGEGKYELNI